MSDDLERLKAQRNQIAAEIRRLQDSVRSEVESDLEEGDPALYEREKNLALLQHLERELRRKDRPGSAEGHTPGHVMSQMQNGSREEEADMTSRPPLRSAVPHRHKGYPRG